MRKKNLYIIADCSDNSVTISSDLCKELRIETSSSTKIFLFQINDSKEFAFKRVSAKFATRTECAVVSFNSVIQQFGFIALVPTVNYIFYRMGITEQVQRLSVEKRQLVDGSNIYVIKKLDDKGN